MLKTSARFWGGGTLSGSQGGAGGEHLRCGLSAVKRAVRGGGREHFALESKPVESRPLSCWEPTWL